MARSPMALQLRYLQTLLEIGATNATTIVFPAPIDMLTAFMGKADERGGGTRLAARRARRSPRGSGAPPRSQRRGSGPCPWPA